MSELFDDANVVRAVCWGVGVVIFCAVAFDAVDGFKVVLVGLVDLADESDSKISKNDLRLAF